ncbi:hypothetical protein R3W88_006663 [Solanum pinnatisectum]|uniref:Retrotransposon gag domain-containing protein n=1 Tax=Solanum pinnatisectum TaxID=50273 RepID=A0AAV9KFE3_9SOLN|nr:hypothetical protein R3W88_006663 [Solanum pinnatisectum]
MWLSLPCLYFDGEALAWFNWLYRNKQFYDWKHFTDKLFYHYRRQTVTEFGLPPVIDLLLQIDVNLSRMHRHLDNIHNTLSACSQKFYDAPAHSYLTASLADKCDIEEVAEQEFNSVVTHTIETLGPMLESKNDLKDDPINYACKMFAEMPNKKIAMKVEHTVINDSENLASHMFDEMFQTISAVKGEYNDLVMFNMQLGLGIALCSEGMSGMLSTCTYVQLINRGIIDHFSRLGHASLILTLHLILPDQFGLALPFDLGSRLLTTVLRVTRNYVFCVALDNLDHNKLIMSTLWYSCI